jgi:hypothetical protein
MDRKAIGGRKINSYEIDATLHESRYEGDIPSEPVKLRDDELCLVKAACGERSGQLRSVGALAALNLHKFRDEAPLPSIEVLMNRSPLSFQP